MRYNLEIMLLPEIEPFSVLTSSEQNAIVGIRHANPNKFKESYWKELIQWQIDGDRSRELTLVNIHPDKIGQAETFGNLRERIQSLPEDQRETFLRGVLGQIYQADQVLLIETDRVKYMPLNDDPPKT